MFKKLFVILAGCALAVCLGACGSPADETVEVTLPAAFVEQYDISDVENLVEQEGIEAATKNEDGSITWVMTKQKHDELMQSLRDSFDTSFSEMVGSEQYPNFKDIRHNDNFTEFTVQVDGDQLGLAESLSTLIFYMAGGFYNIFDGAPTDNVNVQFVNANTGEVISSANSADAGQQTGK